MNWRSCKGTYVFLEFCRKIESGEFNYLFNMKKQKNGQTPIYIHLGAYQQMQQLVTGYQVRNQVICRITKINHVCGMGVMLMPRFKLYNDRG